MFPVKIENVRLDRQVGEPWIQSVQTAVDLAVQKMHCPQEEVIQASEWTSFVSEDGHLHMKFLTPGGEYASGDFPWGVWMLRGEMQ